MSRPVAQPDLFGHVLNAYIDAPQGELTTQALYQEVAVRAGVPTEHAQARSPVGRAGTPRSLFQRKVRWCQQDLKAEGLLQRSPRARGLWSLASRDGKTLTEANSGMRLVAFSTNLGCAIWGRAETALAGFSEQIHLIATSPPFLLAQPRRYGGPAQEQDYIDFLCRALEPSIAHLAPGGSICLNLTNDSFMRGLPARSTYLERLTLALCDRMGMSLMDRIVWPSNKPPAPVQWASKQRVQLNSGYEPILWLCTDPARCFADNRRVLQPHSERHRKLIERGGEQRTAVYGDGAYRLRPGSFGNRTEGRIPRNVIPISNRCRDGDAHRRYAAEHRLPAHGAKQPVSVAEFLIRFLTAGEEHLVLDPFAGTGTTALAAERLGRRWIAVEAMLEYLLGGAQRFSFAAGFRGAA